MIYTDDSYLLNFTVEVDSTRIPLSDVYFILIHFILFILMFWSGITACIVARIHIINSHGLSGVAHQIHIVREVNGRSGNTKSSYHASQLVSTN